MMIVTIKTQQPLRYNRLNLLLLNDIKCYFCFFFYIRHGFLVLAVLTGDNIVEL